MSSKSIIIIKSHGLNITSKDNISQDIQEGLFGYTAFYRLKTGEGRRYSLTAPGSTKVLGGEQIPFEGTDEKLARDWFIKNLKKDDSSLSIITKSINDKIPKSIKQLSNNDIVCLLSGIELDIGGENSITISLDSKTSFYLLGECANESIGININGITLKSKNGTGPIIKQADESYSGDIKPTDNYVGGINISSRNLSVPMIPGAYQHDIGLNLLGRNSGDKTKPGIDGGDVTNSGIRGK